MAIYMWREEETPTIVPLNFTAEEANSTVQLNKNGNPTEVELETSTDGNTWTDYTIGDTITLANVGDKVYMRNKSETDTNFSLSGSSYYGFSMTGKIGASGDVTSLLNKNGTNTLTNFCFRYLFLSCTSLTTAPELPATELAAYCYFGMFDGCAGLTIAPELPATTLAARCYHFMFSLCTSLTTPSELPATTLSSLCYAGMFDGCTGIKLSETETSEYNIPYRIPTTGTGIDTADALNNMFRGTGGTFTGTPSINTTYYLWNPQPVNTPGIYHNETEGLISLSSDGENWITIADKNLGATQVWNDGDELTNANCGNYFQWGNNYGFPGPEGPNPTVSNTEVDLTGYGPGNYYTSNLYNINITGDFSNLWGGAGDSHMNDGPGTKEDRRGPCPEGFHVPSYAEFRSIERITRERCRSCLFIPNAGYRNHYDATSSVDLPRDIYGEPFTMMRTSSYAEGDSAHTVQIDDFISVGNYGNIRQGFSIRPFKNTPVIPDSTRTVLYQPAPALLSYEEIKALPYLQNVIETLNANPEEYYNSLMNESHLDALSGGDDLYYIVENIGDREYTTRPDERDPSRMEGAMYSIENKTWYWAV